MNMMASMMKPTPRIHEPIVEIWWQLLELREVVVVAARHAARAQHELREERDVEADEHEEPADARPALVVHLAGELRPPVVEAADEAHHGAADHDVVEVRHDEVRVVEVHVDREHAEEEAREAADREEEEERQRPEHRRLRARSSPCRASRSS